MFGKNNSKKQILKAQITKKENHIKRVMTRTCSSCAECHEFRHVALQANAVLLNCQAGDPSVFRMIAQDKAQEVMSKMFEICTFYPEDNGDVRPAHVEYDKPTLVEQ